MTEPCWYLYCVAEGETAPPLDPPLQVISHGDLHAVVRAASPGEFTAGELSPAMTELLLAHDRVIRQVMETHDLLPLRFGTAITGLADLAGYLAADREGLKSRLRRVRGHLEWGVKWRRPAPPTEDRPEPPEGGRGYLRHRLAEQQRQQQEALLWRQLTARAHRELAALASDAVPDDRASQEGTVEVGCSYLVTREAADRFRHTVDLVAADLSAHGVSVRMSGPWPPYSFCERGDQANPSQ